MAAERDRHAECLGLSRTARGRVEEVARLGVGDEGLRRFPQVARPVGDGGIAREDTRGGDAVLAPHRAAVGVVEQEGLEPVDRAGEARVVGLARFEFVPRGAELCRLWLGQDARRCDPRRPAPGSPW